MSPNRNWSSEAETIAPRAAGVRQQPARARPQVARDPVPGGRLATPAGDVGPEVCAMPGGEPGRDRPQDGDRAPAGRRSPSASASWVPITSPTNVTTVPRRAASEFADQQVLVGDQGRHDRARGGQVEAVQRHDDQRGDVQDRTRRPLPRGISGEGARRPDQRGRTTGSRRRDHRSISTPANGPTIEKGMTSMAKALATPAAVPCASGEQEDEPVDQECLEDPVGELAEEPCREQAWEVRGTQGGPGPRDAPAHGRSPFVRASGPTLRPGPRWPAPRRRRTRTSRRRFDAPLPRMNSSTISRAASSENCTGGDFMK